MPEYLSPGVYIEEIDAGPRPIAGVSTSTAGMVGATVRGPTRGKPVLVTSLVEFERQFGGLLPEPDAGLVTQWSASTNVEGGTWWRFPLAVRGFFDNGGQRLFVKRVAASGAVPSTGAFVNGLVAVVTQKAAAGTREVVLDHLVGIQANIQVQIVFRDGAIPPTQQVTVASYRPGAANQNRITLGADLARGLVPGQALVQIAQVAAANVATTLEFTAAAPGAWGNGIRLRVSPDVITLGLLADPTEPSPFATQVAGTATVPANATIVPVRAVPGLTPLPAVPFFAQIGSGTFTVSAVAPLQNPPNALQLTLQGATQHPAWNPGTPVRRVRRVNIAAGPLRVAGASRLYAGAMVELDNGSVKQTLRVEQVDGEVVTFSPAAAAGYLETHRLHLVEIMVQASYTDDSGAVVGDERISNIRLRQGDDLAAERRVNDVSNLVSVVQQADLAGAPLLLPVPADLAQGLWVPLANGNDEYNTLSPDDFVGFDGGSGRRTGIQALEDIDEVAICAVPGMWSGTVQSNLIQHCELLKDRFAVLDPPDGLTTQQIQDFRSSYDTRYAALYYPWLVTRDPLSDRDVNVPPSGHMVGIYARVDDERGVHKAPANVPIRGIRTRPPGISLDVTKRNQDLLNPRGINALRAFPNRGSRVWGARTLSSDTTWQYVNVRRLFIYLEESIEEGTQWVVFEPNDEALWALVRQTVSNFLTTEWRNGRLRGLTPDEAFFVRCDATTMTETDIASGRLICVVGVAPVFPAEFVIFRIQQKTRELQPA